MLPIIKSLWVGPELSKIERLSLQSFVANGHEVQLFTYHPVKGVPEDVSVRNGNDILAEPEIAQFRENNYLSGFADWFRYELLFREGGIWVDTDVVCLKPFDFNASPAVFGQEEYKRFNNAVLGGDPGQELFKFMAKQAEFPNRFLPFDRQRDKRRKLIRKCIKGNNRARLKWGEVGPTGLTRAIQYFDLQHLSLPHIAFYPIHSKCWHSMFDLTYEDIDQPFPGSYAIHLWNEMIRKGKNIDKNGPFLRGSLIHTLVSRYGA